VTGVRDETKRAPKRRPCLARALAILWAGWWTLWIMALSFPFLRLGYWGSPSTAPAGPIPGVLTLALVVCIPWVSAVLAWRREVLGGLVLVLEGLLLLAVALNVIVETVGVLAFGEAIAALPFVAAISGSLSVPPLVAGILFLTSWWRSRSSRVPPNRV